MSPAPVLGGVNDIQCYYAVLTPTWTTARSCRDLPSPVVLKECAVVFLAMFFYIGK